MHHDPLTSTATKAFFFSEHVWVVLAVVVEMPWGKRLSLPVWVRLYRTARVNAQLGRVHEKKTDLGAAMLVQLATAYAGRTSFVGPSRTLAYRTPAPSLQIEYRQTRV